MLISAFTDTEVLTSSMETLLSKFTTPKCAKWICKQWWPLSGRGHHPADCRPFRIVIPSPETSNNRSQNDVNCHHINLWFLGCHMRSRHFHPFFIVFSHLPRRPQWKGCLFIGFGTLCRAVATSVVPFFGGPGGLQGPGRSSDQFWWLFRAHIPIYIYIYIYLSIYIYWGKKILRAHWQGRMVLPCVFSYGWPMGENVSDGTTKPTIYAWWPAKGRVLKSILSGISCGSIIQSQKSEITNHSELGTFAWNGFLFMNSTKRLLADVEIAEIQANSPLWNSKFSKPQKRCHVQKRDVRNMVRNHPNHWILESAIAISESSTVPFRSDVIIKNWPT